MVHKYDAHFSVILLILLLDIMHLKSTGLLLADRSWYGNRTDVPTIPGREIDEKLKNGFKKPVDNACRRLALIFG